MREEITDGFIVNRLGAITFDRFEWGEPEWRPNGWYVYGSDRINEQKIRWTEGRAVNVNLFRWACKFFFHLFCLCKKAPKV